MDEEKKEIRTYEDIIDFLGELESTLRVARDDMMMELTYEFKNREISFEDQRLKENIESIEGSVKYIERHIERRLKHIVKNFHPDVLYRDIEFAVTRQIPYEMGYLNELYNKRSQFDGIAQDNLEELQSLSSLRNEIEKKFREAGGLKQAHEKQEDDYKDPEIQFFIKLKDKCAMLLDTARRLKGKMENE